MRDSIRRTGAADSGAGRPRAPRSRGPGGAPRALAAVPSSGGASSPVRSVSTSRGSREALPRRRGRRRGIRGRSRSPSRRRGRGNRPRGPATPSSAASREAIGDLAGRDPVERLAASRRRSRRPSGPGEGDKRGEARLERAGRDDADRGPASSAACSAERITFELSGSTTTSSALAASIAASSSAVGRVHRLAALDDPRGAEALEQPAVAFAGADGDHGAARCRPGGVRPVAPRAPRSGACMSAISTRLDGPRGAARASAASGSSVWTCALSAVRSPTTISESPRRPSSRSSESASSSSPSTTKIVQ